MSLDVKICGLKSAEAVNAAVGGGATHVGFIFFPRSPRHIPPADAAALRRLAGPTVSAVAVTVDATDDLLDDIVAAVKPDILQLHGSETPDRVTAIRARHGLPVIKAISIRDASDLAAIGPYLGIADRFLLDAKPPAGADLPGGNGVAFDWRLLSALDRRVDYMLSGGLNAANIAEALALANPSGIDVSSGVESAPGVKDMALIADFFRAVRSAQAGRAA